MRQAVTHPPFDLRSFLSLPSLYFTSSLLFLGLLLFFSLFTPGHQFYQNTTILGIPVPILSTGLALLITLVPCSLLARNFQVLSRAVQPLVVSECVTSEEVLEFAPIAAHAILGYALSFCFVKRRNCHTQICPASSSLALLAIADIYNNPITRISLIVAITTALFATILHVQADMFHQADKQQVFIIPVAFLALSALAALFPVLAWPIRRLLG